MGTLVNNSYSNIPLTHVRYQKSNTAEMEKVLITATTTQDRETESQLGEQPAEMDKKILIPADPSSSHTDRPADQTYHYTSNRTTFIC